LPEGSRIEKLEHEVAALRAMVARLSDVEEIRSLIGGYGPAVDRGDSMAAAGLWADDGVYDLGELGSRSGHEAIAALLDGAMHQDLIHGGAAHLLGPPRIDLDGDEAIAVCHSCVIRWTGDVFELFRVAANRWALRRTPLGWRVTERTNRLLTGSADARALFA